jgi:hypothetical protein
MESTEAIAITMTGISYPSSISMSIRFGDTSNQLLKIRLIEDTTHY